MTNREGNLEAPTRHPVDWKNPEFYDQAACERELTRVFDICHGCRRCVSLCLALPSFKRCVRSVASSLLRPSSPTIIYSRYSRGRASFFSLG